VTANPATLMARGLLSPGSEFRRFVNITVALATTEFKIRYFGSVLGYLWSLMRPLMLFGVLYVVFTHIVRFGGGITNYPLKLLLGIVLWSYFAEATGQSVGCLVQRENLLRKISFPSIAIPLAVTLTSGFNLLLNLLVVLVFVLVSGISPAASWLELVPLVGVLIVLTASVSLLVSLLYVPFRDMLPIWEVATQLLFWGTPIIYVIESAPSGVRELLLLNPLAVVIEQARHVIIDPAAPSAAAAAGGTMRLLVPLAIVGGLVAISTRLYKRAAPNIAERL
jgi:ABC-2 type transport system permease protein